MSRIPSRALPRGRCRPLLTERSWLVVSEHLRNHSPSACHRETWARRPASVLKTPSQPSARITGGALEVLTGRAARRCQTPRYEPPLYEPLATTLLVGEPG